MNKVFPPAFSLERWSSKVTDDCFQCPECGQWYSAEYWVGDPPYDGLYDIECDCGCKFGLMVETFVKYTPGRSVPGMTGAELINKFRKGE